MLYLTETEQKSWNDGKNKHNHNMMRQIKLLVNYIVMRKECRNNRSYSMYSIMPV